MSASSVRPWPCPARGCGAQAGEPCRTAKTRRVTDTHVWRLAPPTTHRPEESPDELHADEMRTRLDEARAEIRALDYAIRVLTDQQRELREEVVGIDKALTTFEAAR